METTTLYSLLGGGGFFTSSTGQYLKLLPAPANTRIVTSIHSTYDEKGCSEKCKKAFSQAFQTNSFSPGDFIGGLLFQSLPPEGNPFDPELYSRTMTMNLLFNPNTRVMVPPNACLSDVVRQRIAEESETHPDTFRQEVANEMIKCAELVDARLGKTFKMYHEKTSLANLLVLATYHAFECNMNHTTQLLNTVLHTDSSSFAVPVTVENSQMIMHLKDGNTIDCQHDITCCKAKYTAKPDYMELIGVESRKAPQPDPMVLQTIRHTVRSFLSGGGSAFDSTLVHFLTEGIVPEIQKQVRKGRRSVYYLKPMVELQTASLSIEEILLVYERSIQKLYPDFHIESLLTDIILPEIPQSLLSQYAEQISLHAAEYLSDKGKYKLSEVGFDLEKISEIMQDISLFSESSLDDIRTGVTKPAKLGACCPAVIKESDYAFLSKRGITVYHCSDFGLWEGSIQYDPRSITQMMMQIAPGSPLMQNAGQIAHWMKDKCPDENFRLEYRANTPKGVGQIALIGYREQTREKLVEELSAMELPQVRFRASGYMTIEAQHSQADKTIPIRYVYAKRKQLFPDYKENKRILICDGDGTLYGKPTAEGLPALDTSPHLPAVLNRLSLGEYLVVNTSNDLDTTAERLIRGNAIPEQYYNHVLIAACNGAILAQLAHPYTLIEDYSDFALDVANDVSVLPEDFCCLYFGDETKQDSEDMKAFLFVGKERSVLITDQTENLPAFLFDRSVRNFGEAFAFEQPNVEEVVEAFRDSLPGIPVNKSFPIGSGKPDGVCFGIDFGGTWLRVDMLEFEIEKRIPNILQSDKMQFSSEQKSGKINPFELTAQFIFQNFSLLPGKEYVAGISFSQPIRQIAPDDIRITMSAKGWDLSGYIGKNLYTLFNEAFRKWGIKLNLKIIANDVACTHLFMPEAHFAVVIGTGFAFSHFDTGCRICVVEGGEFTPFDVMNVIDTEMWLNEEPRGRRAAEKMISGKYLWKNIWLQRQRQSAGESSPEPYSENLIPILSQQHDLLTIAAVRRSGTLVGSMLKSFCPQDTNDPIRIIADGTVIQSLPEIRLSIEKALDPHPVILILQHDAAIYGSAKAALSS